MIQPIVQIYSNPSSGQYQPERVALLAQAFAAAGAEVRQAESSPNAASPIDLAADLVCVVGGDGTLRHVAAALQAAGHGARLCVYPAGTVNLVHREIGLPTDPAAFVAAVLPRQQHRAHFLAEANGTPFLACASVGPDSAAVAALSEPLKRVIGRLAYVVAFLGVLWRWPRPQLHLRANDIELPCEAVFVAKGRYYAGPWSFAPAARLDAPHLHVVAIERLTRWSFLRFMACLLLHRPLTGRRGFICLEASALAIEGSADHALQVDGDAAGSCPAKIAVLPAPTWFARPAADHTPIQ